MKKGFFLLLMLQMGFLHAVAQTRYFQQDLVYDIKATLDDSLHLLKGHIDIEYTNNAPQALEYIYLHLYPNAYNSQKSAFAKQQLAQGKSRYYFATDAERGKITDLALTVDGRRVVVEIDKEHPDVAKVVLSYPLLPTQRVKISTPFTYKIPYAFSRGGRVEQAYFMTQWYPKPAVFDKDGWHPVPYLDQGEFYGEFGRFDVTLTLPANYVVGATGQLETASEHQFLSEKQRHTEGVLASGQSVRDTFPPTATATKTIRYTAEKVHDFAWFADKRFWVLSDSVVLKNGHLVKTYAYFLPEIAKYWKDAPRYLKQAISHYSEEVGPYPYPHASAVGADGSYSSGMEYPMITVIGSTTDAESVDITIAHEIGHNWFYGILASNERDYAWLDEGLNSFYDKRYRAKYYDKTEDVGLPRFLTKGQPILFEDLLLDAYYKDRRDQAPMTHSEALSSFNYFVAAYEKPARSLQLLEAAVGRARFDAIMQDYYQKYQFKHPQPLDFQQHWETSLGTKDDLKWFFEGLIGQTTKTHYVLKKCKEEGDTWQVTVVNKGIFAPPYSLSVVTDTALIVSHQMAGHIGERTFSLPKAAGTYLILDKKNLLPEDRRTDNILNINAKKGRPIDIRWGLGIDAMHRRSLYIAPAVAYNQQDGGSLGIALYNGLLPKKNLEWGSALFYGFGSRQLTGTGFIQKNIYVGHKKWTFGLEAKRFSFDYNDRFDTPLLYTRYAPSVRLEWGKADRTASYHRLTARYLYIQTQSLAFDTAGLYTGKETAPAGIAQLMYRYKTSTGISRTSLDVLLEQQGYPLGEVAHRYVKLSATLNKSWAYQQNKYVRLRLFAGGFLQNTGRTSGNFYGLRSRGSLGLLANGTTDYTYDEPFFARNSTSGFWSRQISAHTEGGMKFNVPADVSQTEVGFSNNYLVSANLTLDLPVALPRFLNLKPYIDWGYFSDTRPASLRASQQTLLSGGLAWTFGDIAALYIPLYYSGKPLSEDPNSFRAIMTKRPFVERITFSLDLKKLNPYKWLEVIRL